MEQTWRDVFRITEEEENNFDKDHSEHIDRYINANNNRVQSFPTANMNELNTDFNTREITVEEIKGFIRRSKKKTPGSTKINKEILEKCTDKTLDQLKNIFNACLSAGTFLTCLKRQLLNLYRKRTKLL